MTIDAAMAELARQQLAMCACVDGACRDRVHRDRDAYQPTLEAAITATTPTAEQLERIEQLDAALRGCRA